MKIEIGRLLQEPGAAQAFDFQVEPPLQKDNDYNLLTPIQVKGTLTNSGNDLTLEAHIAGEAILSCSRCLEPVKQVFAGDVTESYEYEEFEDQEYFDLADVAFQLWLTTIPMQIFCKEDCQGLCQHCGQDLNKGLCSCEKDDIDPRLAVLKDLLVKEE